jgi:hypothetical protein
METMVGGQTGGVIEKVTPAAGASDANAGAGAGAEHDGGEHHGAGHDGGEHHRAGQEDVSPAATWASLAAASAAVVGSTPRVWTLSDAEILTALVTDQVAAAQREAGRLALIRELDSRGVAAQGGATSTAAYLAHQLLIDGARAASDVRAARALDPAGDQPPEPGAPTPSRSAPDVASPREAPPARTLT